MKLVAVLNRDIKLGEALNALGHMALGLGHQVEGEPHVSIYFGTKDQVRDFRTLASKMNLKQKAICTDFPHTMSGVSADGSSTDQVSKTAAIVEDEITYFGCCFVSEEIDPSLIDLIKSCSQLKNYKTYESTSAAKLLSIEQNQEYEGSKKRFSLLINKLSIAETINHVALTSLMIGRKVKFPDLYMINLRDKDGNYHGNISFHPLVILKSKTSEDHEKMAADAEKFKDLHAASKQNEKGVPLVTLVFGDEVEVQKIATREQTRLYADALEKNDLVPAILENKNSQSKASESKEEVDLPKDSNIKKYFSTKITFIGAGEIAKSFIQGLVQNNYPKANIIVSNRSPEKVQKLIDDFGIQSAKDYRSAIKNTDVIVIAVLSKAVQNVAKEIADALKSEKKKPLFVCLSSGVCIEDLDQWLGGNCNIIRAMTSATLSVKAGVSALLANQKTSQWQKEMAQFLFDANGKSIWVESESKLDDITPWVGCGPAYGLTIIDIMIKGAVNQGVPYEIARDIVLQNMQGAVSMAQKNSQESIDKVRKKITTPNGVTEASLKSLLAENIVERQFDIAFKTAIIRCKELGEQSVKNSTPITDFFKSQPNISQPIQQKSPMEENSSDSKAITS